jgi:hypothetical protein
MLQLSLWTTPFLLAVTLTEQMDRLSRSIFRRADNWILNSAERQFGLLASVVAFNPFEGHALTLRITDDPTSAA